MALQAVTAAALLDALTAWGNVPIPATFTPAKMDEILKRQTALVLTLRGLTGLPAGDGIEEQVVQEGVLSLAVIQAKRFLRGDDRETLRLLEVERKAIIADLTLGDVDDEHLFFQAV